MTVPSPDHNALTNHKTLLQALCAQTQHQQQQTKHHTDTLQVDRRVVVQRDRATPRRRDDGPRDPRVRIGVQV